jgi:LmbE family N-acetylglucosaminyl deacetylase
MSGAPEPATVVTLFAGLPDAGVELSPWDKDCGGMDPAQHTLRRRMEDEAALTKCGARFIHCDFLALRYRARDKRGALVDRLEELAGDADEMWLPAGIGGHPDHILAAEAGLSASVRCRRVLYADLPYATRREAKADRPVRETLRKKMWTALWGFPHALGPPPMSYRLTGPEQDAKRRCLQEYDSQLAKLRHAFPEWWENPAVFEWEWWWPLDEGLSSKPSPVTGAPVSSDSRQPGAPPDPGVLMCLRGGWRAHLWPVWRRRRWSRIPRAEVGRGRPA